MRVFRVFGIFVLFFMSVLTAQSATTSPVLWFTPTPNNKVVLRVDLFLVSTCAHCHKADAFFKELAAKNDWLDVKRHVINQDKNDLFLFNTYLQQQGVHDFSVPAIFFCNSRWVGFDSAQTTGQSLLQGLAFCHREVIRDHQLSNTTIASLQQLANSYFMASTITKKAAQSHYTLLWLAVIAALSPCLMITVFLLFVLMSFQSGWSQRSAVLLSFLMVVAVLNYIQLQHWAFYSVMIPYMRGLALLIAVAGFYLFTKYLQKSTPRLGIVLMISALLALSVQVYQQACLPNFSLIFQQRLIAQAPAGNPHILLTLLYNTIYALSIGLVACLLLVICKVKQFRIKQKHVENFCLTFLFIVSFLLLFRPEVLSSYISNFLIIILSMVLPWILKQLKASGWILERYLAFIKGK